MENDNELPVHAEYTSVFPFEIEFFVFEIPLRWRFFCIMVFVSIHGFLAAIFVSVTVLTEFALTMADNWADMHDVEDATERDAKTINGPNAPETPLEGLLLARIEPGAYYPGGSGSALAEAQGKEKQEEQTQTRVEIEEAPAPKAKIVARSALAGQEEKPPPPPPEHSLKTLQQVQRRPQQFPRRNQN